MRDCENVKLVKQKKSMKRNWQVLSSLALRNYEIICCGLLKSLCSSWADSCRTSLEVNFFLPLVERGGFSWGLNYGQERSVSISWDFALHGVLTFPLEEFWSEFDQPPTVSLKMDHGAIGPELTEKNTSREKLKCVRWVCWPKNRTVLRWHRDLDTTVRQALARPPAPK